MLMLGLPSALYMSASRFDVLGELKKSSEPVENGDAVLRDKEWSKNR